MDDSCISLYDIISNFGINHEIVDGDLVFNTNNKKLIVHSPRGDIDYLFYTLFVRNVYERGVFHSIEDFNLIVTEEFGINLKDKKDKNRYRK